MMTSLLPEIKTVLQKTTDIVICCHIDPDGDAIGSLLGLGLTFKNQGRKVQLVSPDGIPLNLRFLPGANETATNFNTSSDRIAAIVLDCGDLDRLGPIAQEVGVLDCIINIDHHPTNTLFGTINWVDPKASATAEMVFYLLQDLSIPVSKNAATCLYAGIHTDTGGFRYQNTTAQVHQVAQQLIQAGVKPWEVVDRIYDTKSLSQIRLLQEALARLQVTSDGRIAWISLPQQVLKSCNEDDTSGLINYPRMIAGTELAILLKEDDNGQVRIGLRSRELIDVGLLAHGLGGGGHPRAAGCVLPGPLASAEKKVLAVAQQALQEAKG